MQIAVFISTILGASYFLLFDSDSKITGALVALLSLGWPAFFLIRLLTERKKVREERKKLGERKKKGFVDPQDLINQRKKDDFS